jgi:hypothetical protein
MKQKITVRSVLTTLWIIAFFVIGAVIIFL